MRIQGPLSHALAAPLLALAIALPAAPARAAENCQKSVSVAKGISRVHLSRARTVNVRVRVNTFTGKRPNTDGVCANPATVEGGTAVVQFFAAGAAQPLVEGQADIPPRGRGYKSRVVTVPVVLETAPPLGTYNVVCNASVTFSADSTVNGPQTYGASGDSAISFLEPAPGSRSRPILDVEVLDDVVREVAAGARVPLRVRIRNNNRSAVTLQAELMPRQTAVVPKLLRGADRPAAFAFSESIGGAPFPVEFVGIRSEKQGRAAQTQRSRGTAAVVTERFTLAPGARRDLAAVVTVPESMAGTTTELRFCVAGEFANGRPIEACVGTSVTVKPQTASEPPSASSPPASGSSGRTGPRAPSSKATAPAESCWCKGWRWPWSRR